MDPYVRGGTDYERWVQAGPIDGDVAQSQNCVAFFVANLRRR